MKLTIGTNIKRLRAKRSMTQEQLAELLGITCAAVSKWERGDSCPDIGFIIPLAQVFDVTIDELMGYDVKRVEAEIDGVLKNYNSLHAVARFDEAAKLLTEARKNYPNSYRIMSIYMKNLVGKNDRGVINEHRDELLKLCDCILDGCDDEQIRLEALFVRAKLEYAAGRTDDALGMLEGFPKLEQTKSIKTEQLFPMDTSEYLVWTKRNMYMLAEQTAFRMVRSIVLDGSAELSERVRRVEAIGDTFTELRVSTGETVFAIMERSVFSHLHLQLKRLGGEFEDILRLTEKELRSIEAWESMAATDSAYSVTETGSFLKTVVGQYKNSQHPTWACLRERSEYMALLEKYS